MKRASSRNDLSFYRSLAQAAPQLSAEHEAALVHSLRAGNRQAGEELARAAQRHVLGLALKYRRYGVPVSELVAEGNLGVVQALRKFEPERGVRFVTYASYWVRANMLGCVVRTRSLVGRSDGPMRSQLFFRLRRERARVFSELGESEAAKAELARRLRVSSERLGQLLERLEAREVSLEVQLVAADETQEQLLSRHHDALRVHGLVSLALQHLDPRERQIVEQRSMADRDDELSLAELARRLGISRERARQLEARAFAKLRSTVLERDPSFVRDFLGAA